MRKILLAPGTRPRAARCRRLAFNKKARKQKNKKTIPGILGCFLLVDTFVNLW